MLPCFIAPCSCFYDNACDDPPPPSPLHTTVSLDPLPPLQVVNTPLVTSHPVPLPPSFPLQVVAIPLVTAMHATPTSCTSPPT